MIVRTKKITMNEGRQLKMFIKGKGLTVADAAKLCGKTRATLQNYFNQHELDKEVKIVLTSTLGIQFEPVKENESESGFSIVKEIIKMKNEIVEAKNQVIDAKNETIQAQQALLRIGSLDHSSVKVKEIISTYSLQQKGAG